LVWQFEIFLVVVSPIMTMFGLDSLIDNDKS
jgi:hypothetical protein